jgi:hypothetical protein
MKRRRARVAIRFTDFVSLLNLYVRDWRYKRQDLKNAFEGYYSLGILRKELYKKATWFSKPNSLRNFNDIHSLASIA